MHDTHYNYYYAHSTYIYMYALLTLCKVVIKFIVKNN